MHKTINTILRNTAMHWVGDGFPVTTLFSYHEHTSEISPFLLLDYAGPAEFPPTTEKRGVGVHPHRGFETVTIVYHGEVAHKDSAGNAGTIGVGDVQWMTAARGVLHEEMHGEHFRKTGGVLEMVQLWVNLPKAQKMSAPRYQEILSSHIPSVVLPGNAGTIRLIAGDYNGSKGAAKTFSPVIVWDIGLMPNAKVSIDVPEGYNANLLNLRAPFTLHDGAKVNTRDLAVFSRTGGSIEITASTDGATCLLLAGEPIDEPVVGHGPFVMNTEEEIKTAFADFRAGRF